ncbi:MAG: hypothetical protein IJ836_07110 [Spirochaetales bacterium]|nr:hypothetical protein [Spirochaetales bacterium]
MRKCISILILLCAVSSLFAVSHVQFGPSATAIYELNGNSDIQKTLGDFDNYTFGFDGRLTLKKFQLSGLAQLKVNGDVSTLNTNLSLNYVFYYGKMVNISAGLGPRCVFQTEDWKDWKTISTSDENKEVKFLDALKESNITYRIGADFSFLGLGVGVAYYVPADASISDMGASWLPDFDKGSVSFSLLFGIL